MTNKYYVDYINIINAINNPQDTKNLETVVADIVEFLNLKKEDETLKLVIRAKKEDIVAIGFTKQIQNFFPALSEVNVDAKDVLFVVENNAQSYVYESREWNVVRTLANFVEKRGATFGIEDINKTFSLQEVESANAKIGATADAIKSKDFSPYEKLMAAYLKVTSREYVQAEDDEEASISRSLYNVLNSNKIVCVGYAYWLKAIMDTIGDNNVKIYPNSVACSRDNVTIDGYHANLIIYIKDEKYGIDGYYYVDPTWDCTQKEGKYSGAFNFFLVPLSDIDKISFHIREKGMLDDYYTYKSFVENKHRREITNTSKKYNVRESTQMVSFTSDGFVPSPEFLRDFFRLKPKQTQRLLEDIQNNTFTECLYESDQARARIEIVDKVKTYLANRGIESLERYDGYSLNGTIVNAIEASDPSIALDMAKKLADEYIDGNRYERIETDFVMTLIENMFSKDYSVHYFLGIDVSDTEDAKLINYLSKKIHDYLSENKKYVCSLERFYLGNEMKNKIFSFAKKCKTEQDIDGLIEFIDKTIKEIPNNYTFIGETEDIKKLIERDQQIINKNNNTLLKLSSIKADTVIIDEILSNKSAQTSVEGLLLGMSDPLELKTMAGALKTVLKTFHTDIPEEKIDAYVNRIVAKNVKNASEKFFGDARNAFSVMAMSSGEIMDGDFRSSNE